MPDSSPGLLFESMEVMENELQGLLDEWAGVAEDLVRATSEVERVKAPKRLELKKAPPVARPTREDLDALLLDWLWNEHEDLMVRQLNNEALDAAYGTRYKVAVKALSSKQTRLNADIKLNGTGR